MTADEINKVIKSVREQKKLVHCITNPISINQCANAVLAVGGRPMMAEHPQEVEEITQTAGALVLNLGNITDVRMKSMMISAKAAIKNKIPFVIDLVGIACSDLRRNFACELMEHSTPTLIKGNYSEVNALYNSSYRSAGVDSEPTLCTDDVKDMAVSLAEKYNSIILASGETDVVTDGRTIVYIKNGTPRLAEITGTGCMLGVMCGCYLSVCSDITAAVTACSVLGICGEMAGTEKGNGSFMVKLMDNLSVLSDKDVGKYLKTEETEVEKN